ncbi:MAG: Nramp family divalent metal transporter [Chitinophagaceae bacterium]|nr:Nramp family divalent metal transporter [Chitinophagaceae bacterium]
MTNKHDDRSLSEVHGSVDTTSLHRPVWRRVLSFFGPAYLVSVGYMDPGNWATDLAGGSKYGYTLIWVLLMSNLMALLLQSLSARLGIVRGRDLAQANRETYPKKVNFILWLLAEIAIAATDLAEILGMAIGIQLLTGLPLIWGVSITVLDTFLLLYLQRLGIRKMEAFIIGLIAVIGICFLVNIIMAQPQLSEVLRGFIPSLPEAKDLYESKGMANALPKETALYLAIGIIGATVMPHNLYLHSALVQTRKIKKSDKGIKQALKFSFIDSAIALNIAFLINAAILILAATVFFQTGKTDIGEIKQAHELLSPMLGSTVASTLFAIALIASGQSSTVTGTLAGQIVMEGYLRLRINPVLRRLITRLVAIVPAIIVIGAFGESQVDSLLVFSQVLLSLQLGFAVIPLIHFVSDKKTMGTFAIKPFVQFLAWLVASVLVYLNLKMLVDEAGTVFDAPGNLPVKVLIILAGLAFVALLVYSIIFPLIAKNKRPVSIQMHPSMPGLELTDIPVYRRIAVALDFSENDTKLIGSAIGQAAKETHFILIHIVESATTVLLGKETDDYETKKDQERLDHFVSQLKEKGYDAEGILGFRPRAKGIARIVIDQKADMLVVGAHGHTGLKDFIYGETINAVRHELKIPVLVVHFNP